MALPAQFDLTKPSGQWRRYAALLKEEIALFEKRALHLSKNEALQTGGAIVALIACVNQADELAGELEALEKTVGR